MIDSQALTLQMTPAMLDAIAELVESRVLERLANLNTASSHREYLTASEAAELLRCSRQRIYDLVSAGRLRRYKDGSRVLLRTEEIEAYLSGSLVAPTLPHARQSRSITAVGE